MIKKFLITILCILLLTGCWDRRELNELGIVMAVGIDKDGSEGNITVTCQIVRPGALKSEGANIESPNDLVSASGDTLFEAIRNISKEFDRMVYFPHTKVIVVNEALAKDGLLPMLDLFERDHEMRHLVSIIVAKDASAREILGVMHGVENIQASYMDNIIKLRKVNSEVTNTNLLQFTQKVTANGINPITGVMKIIKERNEPIEEKDEKVTEGIKLTGTAVYKKDKLIGFLNDDETIGLNWIINEVQSGLNYFPDPIKKDKYIVIEIKRSKTKIMPEIKDGNILFIIEVEEEGHIVEHQGSIDISDIEIIELLEKIQSETITKQMEKTIEKVQKEFKSDIFGFGVSLNRKYPKEWKVIKDRWSEIFPEVDVKIKVDARIRRAGLLQKSFEAKE